MWADAACALEVLRFRWRGRSAARYAVSERGVQNRISFRDVERCGVLWVPRGGFFFGEKESGEVCLAWRSGSPRAEAKENTAGSFRIVDVSGSSLVAFCRAREVRWCPEAEEEPGSMSLNNAAAGKQFGGGRPPTPLGEPQMYYHNNTGFRKAFCKTIETKAINCLHRRFRQTA